MIIYYQKNISKWVWWRKKGAFFFCVMSGLFYSFLYFIANFLMRSYIFPKEGQDPFADSLVGSLGLLPFAAFMSIALWYENQRRYNEWLEKNEKEKE